MKKLLIISNFIVLCLLATAQNPFSLTEGQSVLVYSLPKTELCIEIVTEKVTENPGVFYRYSERYLATDKVITEEKTSYKLKNISVKPRAIADPKRTYSFEPPRINSYNVCYTKLLRPHSKTKSAMNCISTVTVPSP